MVIYIIESCIHPLQTPDDLLIRTVFAYRSSSLSLYYHRKRL